jgi:hypothetical protein
LSTLLVEPLETDLTQDFTVSRDTRLNIDCIKVKLYVCGMPAGNFSLSLLTGSTVLKSTSFACTDLQTFMDTAHSYFYVLYPILFTGLTTLENGTYHLKLSAVSGYTPTKTSYLAWIKESENYFGENPPISMADYPYIFRIIEFKPRGN